MDAIADLHGPGRRRGGGLQPTRDPVTREIARPDGIGAAGPGTSARSGNAVAQTAPSGHLAGVEGLRGVAAILVLVYHAGLLMFPTASGRSGVIGYLNHGLTLFFVLSGFLLFRPFAAALLGGRSMPSVARYLRNRFVRIWPAYVVVLLLANYLFRVARMPGVNPFDSVVEVGTLEPGATLANLFMVQSFSPGLIRSGLEVAWTLSVEVSFYVVLPVLAVVAFSISRRRMPPLVAAVLPAVVLLAIGLGVRSGIFVEIRRLPGVAAWEFQWDDRWTAVLSRSLLAQADLFALGMLTAVAYVLIADGRLSLARDRRSRAALWAFVVLAFAMGVRLPSVLSDVGFGAACAALLLLSVVGTDRYGASRLGTVLDSRVLRYLGVISYSVYLWHLVLIRWLIANHWTASDDLGGAVLNVLLVLVPTVLLASATYFGVEKQALRLKKRRVMSPEAAALDPRVIAS